MEEQVANSDNFVKFIWQGICPPKVENFVWQLLKERVMVRQVIQRLYRSLVFNLECPLCNKEEESPSHLFLTCRWAWIIWSKCIGVWGVLSCSPKTIMEWAAGWTYLCPTPSSDRVWNMVFFVVVWMIWEFRNQKVFKEKEADLMLAVDTINFRIACWYKFHGFGSKELITSILLNMPGLCKEAKRRILSISEGLKFNVDGSSRGIQTQLGL
ncbi:hypothetical protein Dsin_013628 [Dipteronia sinensis]|uniref:Reverse transcriptase zinc-binding domain-containing protein n=1 Tax=Dipteronia sinensis TaxID=43782 RepID=A0AAE0AKB9_9ROSI|nr:hypothetical protein Dsin_013628 [Dipteronia sinensis]